MRVTWSGRAVADLRNIAEYIRQHSPTAARKIAQQIKAGTHRLAQFPLSGRVLPELPHLNYREVIVRDYRIIYEVTGSRVEILAVVHGRRDLPSLLPFDPGL